MNTIPCYPEPEGMKKKISAFSFAILCAVILFFGGANTAMAAARVASVSGNWSSTATWGGLSVPTSADTVTINSGITVTIDIAAAASTLTFAAVTTNSAVNISGTNSLAVTGLVSMPRPSTGRTATIAVGAGTFNAGSLTMSATTLGRNDILSISTGTATIAGTITTGTTGCQLTLTDAGTLNIGGNFTSTPTLTTFTGSMVNYYGNATQTIRPIIYSNLTLSGAGTKNFPAAATVNGNLTLSGTVTSTTAAAEIIGGNLDVGAGATFRTGTTNTWTLGVTGTTNVTGTLTLANTGTKTFTGAVTLNSGSTWSETGIAAVTFNDDLTNNATTFMANTGTHTFGGITHTLSGATTIAIPGTATFTGPYANNGTLTAATLSAIGGTAVLTNNGTITVSTALSGSGGFTQGTMGALNHGGSTIAITIFEASAVGNTVNYTDAAQTVRAVAYDNLILSGSAAKSMAPGTSVAGNLSIAPTGSASASIAAGQNISVDTLTLGGAGKSDGTWGSTSSTATNQNNTYFAPTTGILTVTTDSRVPQVALTATASLSTVSYGSTSTLSSTGGSGTGAVSFSVGASTGCSITGGAILNVTNVSGTCAVTATKAGDDTYKPASSSPLTVTLTKATPILSVTNSPVTYNGTSQSATVTGSVSGTPSNIKYDGSGTAPTNAGTYAVTANFTPADTTNYFSLTDASAGSFVITKVTPTLSVTNSPVAYDAAPHAATVSGSVAGSASAILTGGAASQTNAGTYAVTANFTPADTTNYFSLTDASAGDFVITGVDQTITLDALSDKMLGDPDFVVSATSSSGLTVSFSSLTTSVCTVTDPTVHLVSVGTCTIRAAQGGSGNYNPAPNVDQSFSVNHPATKFVILPPTDGTTDAPVTVTIQAQKADNNIDTSYQDDVTLGTTGSASGGGLVDIENGIGTKNISDIMAESITLSLDDSELTGLDFSSTQPLVFHAGATAQFSLSHPATLAAGERAPYVVTRQDQYGNNTASATSTVYFFSSSSGVNKKFYDAASGGSIVSSIVISGGQSSGNVWYYDELGGEWTITVSDNAGGPDGNAGVNDAIDLLQVNAGFVSKFLFNDPGDMMAGTRLAYTVTRKDQFDNLASVGITPAYLYSDSTGTSAPQFYDSAIGGSVISILSIPNGSSTVSVWYSDPNPGTWTVTASDHATAPDGAAGIIDATDAVVVGAAPIVATRFVIRPSVNGTVDAPITVTVRAEDANGNVDTSYQEDVTLNADGSASGDGLVNIVNGVGTIALADTVPEDVNLSLTDSEATGLDFSSMRVVTFAPGAVAQFLLDNPGDAAAGMRIAYNVTRLDQYGNSVSSGATTVHLYSTSDGVNKKFYDAAIGGSAITSIVIPNGFSSVGFWQYDEKSGNWFVTASDNATVPDGADNIDDASDAITVQPAALAAFVLNEPGNMTAGTRLGYTVTRRDQFENQVTSGVALAYLYSSSPATTTAFYAAATGGSPTTFITINDGNAVGNFWYYDETDGTWLVTVSDSAVAPDGAVGVRDGSDLVSVSATPITATRFVILPVSSVQVGSPATVTVEAQDNAGNIDTTYQSDVMLHASGSATGDGLVNIVNGVGTMTLRDAVAEAVTLSLSDTEDTLLDVSSTRLLTFTATPVVPSSGGIGSTASTPAPAPFVPRVTGVQISGVAFPQAFIHVLATSGEGSAMQGQTTATANGSFSLLLKNVKVGAGSYGIIGIDKLGFTTQTRVFNANYANKDTLLDLGALLLSPTLNLVHPTVRKSDVVGFVGMAGPRYAVDVEIDGESATARTVASADGSYKVLFPTGELALGSHTVRVRQTSPSGKQSENSPQKIFTVTSLFTPQTDFNQDGIINVQDWSIFISRWMSSIEATRLLDDLNNDGKVDVSDLSIFVRTIKR
ncbi:MAG: hypothetical protein A2845_01050 [Candidatus Lloydbacteria bacterium RIFCSPHIGHO2_01_FULL_49_22]|uniref:MBG domain-containing protein n=1 Tax=Candidatus Lloydbacteria bacterium RIFCSPHIGHO2_01_FULL_49_22 TaxID=1798658 RepID=A0A1G2CYB6_9BACT|nr:MAG: hypothetical protein A2845_01050 [Candidatus Lloydbacteria bacterium RIFCSPHIGHO2_01_FULL_49_22]OGZ09933.1 MAG: hypothetical protein A3C14_04420 [Candidatus Lloydbacteria bacterium RIFCSPHIGHO2_02_FULL_50_18]